MSALTHIKRNDAHHAMRALVRELLPSLSWRHHGIGVLQGYVTEEVEPEIRVHIWAEELIKPGMSESGDCHDHRFDMVSHVLAGTVGHEEWFPEEHPEGDHTLMRLTHARAAEDTKFHGPTAPTGERVRVRKNGMAISEGFSYTFPALRFHRSPILCPLTVTCVEKHRQRPVSASVLHPIALAPVMAFGHDMDLAQVARIVAAARDALRAPPPEPAKARPGREGEP